MEQSNLEGKKTPRDFFLYLFSTAAIYYIAVSIISLLWRYVDYFFPDQIGYDNFGLSSGLRWSVASLVVVFPAYILTMRFLARDLDTNPEKQELKVRKWLIFLTLFISAITIIGDLVAIIYNFLGGDLVVRFGLKSLSVLLVAIAIFSYYYFILKRSPGTKEKEGRTIAWVSSALISITVLGAFLLIGSPKTNRLLQLDEKRVSDLQTIQWQIINYWQQKGVLPENLEKLSDSISGFVAPTDPSNKEAYKYTVNDKTSFSLCANFNLENRSQNSYENKPIAPRSVYGTETDNNWGHGPGNQCFEREIDPELYPVREKIK